jgi:hypothetical protein
MGAFFVAQSPTLCVYYRASSGETLIRFLPTLGLAFALGCSPSNRFNSSLNDFDTGDTSVDNSGEGGEDTAIHARPQFWTFDGTIELLDGQIRPEMSSISLTFWFSDNGSCSTTLQLLETEAQWDARPDPTLFGWWTVRFSTPDFRPECDWDITGDRQEAIRLGFGPFDPRLTGALTASGLTTATSSTFGLYLADPKVETHLFILGVAGTEAQFSGPDGFDIDNPLADATYRLASLYRLPF